MSEAMKFAVGSKLGRDLAAGILAINRKWAGVIDGIESPSAIPGAYAEWGQEVYEFCVKGLEAVDKERGELLSRLAEASREARVVVAHSPAGAATRMCDRCGERPARHFLGSAGARCCVCHVRAGCAPADWHRECMVEYEALKAERKG